MAFSSLFIKCVGLLPPTPHKKKQQLLELLQEQQDQEQTGGQYSYKPLMFTLLQYIHEKCLTFVLIVLKKNN